MPKITVSYEVTLRYSEEVEVREEDLQKLIAEEDIDVLEDYGITSETMYQKCIDYGWAESDFAVTDERDCDIIPWRE